MIGIKKRTSLFGADIFSSVGANKCVPDCHFNVTKFDLGDYSHPSSPSAPGRR